MNNKNHLFLRFNVLCFHSEASSVENRFSGRKRKSTAEVQTCAVSMLLSKLHANDSSGSQWTNEGKFEKIFTSFQRKIIRSVKIPLFIRFSSLFREKFN